MRIPCPYCGDREVHEFVVVGDATPQRPDPNAAEDGQAFHDFLYLRENPAGTAHEAWYHASGCRRWLVVTRDTATHAIISVKFAPSQGSDA